LAIQSFQLDLNAPVVPYSSPYLTLLSYLESLSPSMNEIHTTFPLHRDIILLWVHHFEVGWDQTSSYFLLFIVSHQVLVNLIFNAISLINVSALFLSLTISFGSPSALHLYQFIFWATSIFVSKS